MCGILEKFNFSKKFINIIKTLYSNLTADVMVNGVRYGVFKILRGVKQGDALSCVLFVLCMEILLINIQNNADIKGAELYDVAIKNFIFADDTSPMVANRQSIQLVFNEYLKFSKISGIELNHGKTEILPLGRVRFDETPFNLSYNSEILSINNVQTLKIGGIWYGHDKEVFYNKSISERITKLK